MTRPWPAPASRPSTKAGPGHRRCQFAIIKQVCGGLQYDITAQLSMGLANTPMQARISVVSGNFVTAQPLGWTTASILPQRPGTAHRRGGITRQLDQHGLVLISPSAARSPARALT